MVDQVSENGWRRVVAALHYARTFDDAVRRMRGREWVTAFSWAESISGQAGGECRIWGYRSWPLVGGVRAAWNSHFVIQTHAGMEFVVQIPQRVWENSVHRLIDIDETLLFKLVLR